MLVACRVPIVKASGAPMDDRTAGLATDLAKLLLKAKRARDTRRVRRVEQRLRDAMPISTSSGTNSDDVEEGAGPVSAGDGGVASTMDGSPNASADNPTAHDCILCLEPYELNELIRTLPCKHRFHVQCIDRWLFENCAPDKRVCPLCRRDPLSLVKREHNASRCSPFGSIPKALAAPHPRRV